MDYPSFLASKSKAFQPAGFEPTKLPAQLFPFQADLVRWAVRRGRAALFADTGLGKTAMQLAWAHAVAWHMGRTVLILTPLAVAAQTIREASKFGIGAQWASDQPADVAGAGIVVTNYEKLHRFDPAAFAGVVLDEASILKAYSGKTRTQLIDSFSITPYRLCCTATPAPNDHEELGNQAEFLGVCSRTEMLSEFFCHDGGDTSSWRLKGHAKDAFWRWLCSWAIVIRSPADLGYDASSHALPPLRSHEHKLEIEGDYVLGDQGLLFPREAQTLTERRTARKASMAGRVEKTAAMVAAEPDEAWLIWCNLNAEGDALEQAIPGAVQIAGANTADEKEQRMIDFSEGRARVLVTKPTLAGFGLNWQHCSRIAFVGLSDSYEQFYQAIRRCWRFGQTREVHVHLVLSEAEGCVLANLRRKETSAATMGEQMAIALSEIQLESVRGVTRERTVYAPGTKLKAPAWL